MTKGIFLCNTMYSDTNDKWICQEKALIIQVKLMNRCLSPLLVNGNDDGDAKQDREDSVVQQD